MVKINRIEPRKENLAPRPQGWDLRILAGEDVNVDNSDPLAVKLAELNKRRVDYCSQVVPKQLVKEYKQFIDEFKDWIMYKNDLRLVRVCIEYAYFCEEPQLVFAYMQHHKLGEFCALFYLSWCEYLRAKGSLTMAKSVLEAGIASNAQPISMLTQAIGESLAPTASSASSLPSASSAPSSLGAPKRKRKFAIYTDEEPASSVPTNDKLPDFVAEKKENSIQGEKFVVTAKQPVLSLDAVDAALTGNNTTLGDAEIRMLTYHERMLLYRKFNTPKPPFGCRKLKETQHLKTTAIISHDERLYVNHLGHTEVLGKGDAPGDTEVLKH